MNSPSKLISTNFASRNGCYVCSMLKFIVDS